MDDEATLLNMATSPLHDIVCQYQTLEAVVEAINQKLYGKQVIAARFYGGGPEHDSLPQVGRYTVDEKVVVRRAPDGYVMALIIPIGRGFYLYNTPRELGGVTYRSKIDFISNPLVGEHIVMTSPFQVNRMGGMEWRSMTISIL